MKARIFSITAALTLLLLGVSATAFAQLPTACQDGNALLNHDYGFTVNGKIIPPGAPAFVAQQGVALQDFDGLGQFNAVDFIMTNGVAFGGKPTVLNANGFRTNESGTYTVNSDCTGKLTLNDFDATKALVSTIQIRFVLVHGGKEIREVVESITVFPPPAVCASLGQATGCKVNVPATILAIGKKLGEIDGVE